MQKRDCGIILISEGQYPWIFEIVLLRGGVIECIKQNTAMETFVDKGDSRNTRTLIPHDQ